MRLWKARRPETLMELYARTDTKVYAHITFHKCGCVTAWDVKDDRYAELRVCSDHV